MASTTEVAGISIGIYADTGGLSDSLDRAKNLIKALRDDAAKPIKYKVTVDLDTRAWGEGDAGVKAKIQKKIEALQLQSFPVKLDLQLTATENSMNQLKEDLQVALNAHTFDLALVGNYDLEFDWHWKDDVGPTGTGGPASPGGTPPRAPRGRGRRQATAPAGEEHANPRPAPRVVAPAPVVAPRIIRASGAPTVAVDRMVHCSFCDIDVPTNQMPQHLASREHIQNRNRIRAMAQRPATATAATVAPSPTRRKQSRRQAEAEEEIAENTRRHRATQGMVTGWVPATRREIEQYGTASLDISRYVPGYKGGTLPRGASAMHLEKYDSVPTGAYGFKYKGRVFKALVPVSEKRFARIPEAWRPDPSQYGRAARTVEATRAEEEAQATAADLFASLGPVRSGQLRSKVLPQDLSAQWSTSAGRVYTPAIIKRFIRDAFQGMVDRGKVSYRQRQGSTAIAKGGIGGPPDRFSIPAGAPDVPDEMKAENYAKFADRNDASEDVEWERLKDAFPHDMTPEGIRKWSGVVAGGWGKGKSIYSPKIIQRMRAELGRTLQMLLRPDLDPKENPYTIESLIEAREKALESGVAEERETVLGTAVDARNAARARVIAKAQTPGAGMGLVRALVSGRRMPKTEDQQIFVALRGMVGKWHLENRIIEDALKAKEAGDQAKATREAPGSTYQNPASRNKPINQTHVVKAPASMAAHKKAMKAAQDKIIANAVAEAARVQQFREAARARKHWRSELQSGLVIGEGGVVPVREQIGGSKHGWLPPKVQPAPEEARAAGLTALRERLDALPAGTKRVLEELRGGLLEPTGEAKDLFHPDVVRAVAAMGGLGTHFGPEWKGGLRRGLSGDLAAAEGEEHANWKKATPAALAKMSARIADLKDQRMVAKSSRKRKRAAKLGEQIKALEAKRRYAAHGPNYETREERGYGAGYRSATLGLRANSGICDYCLSAATETLQGEHSTPLSRGGGDEHIVSGCAPCNGVMQKGDRPLVVGENAWLGDPNRPNMGTVGGERSEPIHLNSRAIEARQRGLAKFPHAAWKDVLELGRRPTLSQHTLSAERKAYIRALTMQGGTEHANPASRDNLVRGLQGISTPNIHVSNVSDLTRALGLGSLRPGQTATYMAPGVHTRIERAIRGSNTERGAALIGQVYVDAVGRQLRYIDRAIVAEIPRMARATATSHRWMPTGVAAIRSALRGSHGLLGMVHGGKGHGAGLSADDKAVALSRATGLSMDQLLSMAVDVDASGRTNWQAFSPRSRRSTRFFVGQAGGGARLRTAFTAQQVAGLPAAAIIAPRQAAAATPPVMTRQQWTALSDAQKLAIYHQYQQAGTPLEPFMVQWLQQGARGMGPLPATPAQAARAQAQAAVFAANVAAQAAIPPQPAALGQPPRGPAAPPPAGGAAPPPPPGGGHGHGGGPIPPPPPPPGGWGQWSTDPRTGLPVPPAPFMPREKSSRALTSDILMSTGAGGVGSVLKAKYNQDPHLEAIQESLLVTKANIAEALQKTPVRALSVAVGQYFATIMGRGDVRERQIKAEKIGSYAQQALGVAQEAHAQANLLKIQYDIRQREGAPRSELQKLDRLYNTAAQREVVAGQVAADAATDFKKAGSVVSTFGTQMKNLGAGTVGIVAGTLLFKAAMAAGSAVMEQLDAVVARGIDQLTGFSSTLKRVQDQMVAQAMPTGNVRGAAFGQLMGAGLSGGGGIADLLAGRTGGIVAAKRAEEGRDTLRSAAAIARQNAKYGGQDASIYETTGGQFGSFIGGQAPLVETMGNELDRLRSNITDPKSIAEQVSGNFSFIGIAADAVRNLLGMPSDSDPAQQKLARAEQTKYLKSLNDSLGAGGSKATFSAKLAKGVDEEAQRQKQIDALSVRAPELADAVRNGSAIIRDSFGKIVTSGEALASILGSLGKGLQTPDVSSMFETDMTRAIPAALMGLRQQYGLTTGTTAPISAWRSRALNQPMAFGTGLGAVLPGQEVGVGVGVGADAATYLKTITDRMQAGRTAAMGLGTGIDAKMIDKLDALGKKILTLNTGLANQAAVIADNTYAISREVGQRQLTLNQRQINFQQAMAGFVTPGETPAQVAANVAQAKLEADFAQKNQDAQVKLFGLEGQQHILDKSKAAAEQLTAIWTGAIEEAATDIDARIAQGIGLKQVVLSEIINEFTTTGRILDETDSRIHASFAAMSSDYNTWLAALQGIGPMPSTSANSNLTDQRGALPTFAAGGLFDVNSATRMIVGESGNETIAILRNPRPGGGTGMDSGGTININFNGAVVRDDTDIQKLAVAVEQVLNRRYALLGGRR